MSLEETREERNDYDRRNRLISQGINPQRYRQRAIDDVSPREEPADVVDSEGNWLPKPEEAVSEEVEHTFDPDNRIFDPLLDIIEEVEAEEDQRRTANKAFDPMVDHAYPPPSPVNDLDRTTTRHVDTFVGHLIELSVYFPGGSVNVCGRVARIGLNESSSGGFYTVGDCRLPRDAKLRRHCVCEEWIFDAKRYEGVER